MKKLRFIAEGIDIKEVNEYINGIIATDAGGYDINVLNFPDP